MPSTPLPERTGALRDRTARAALVSGLAEMVVRVLTLLLSIVTARTLEPEEVGLLGLAVIIIGVISMMGYYPEMAAVAARGEGHHNKYALSASAIRIIAVVALLTLMAATFPPLARYLAGEGGGGAQLRGLLAILFLGPVLEIVSGYAQVILQRRLDLQYLASTQVLQPAVFVGLATALLLAGQGTAAVAWASITGAGATCALLWLRLLRRGWAGFEGWPSRSIWRETLSGSARLFAGGFGGFIGSRLDNLLVAGALGPAAMSYYSMAWNASRTPAGIFARAIRFVLVPTFTRIHEEPVRVERGLRECLQYSYLLLTPVCAVLLVCAPDLVTIVLGEKWLPVVPALRIMSVTVLVMPVLDAVNALLISAGRAHLTGVATLFHLASLAAFIPFLSARWGIVGAAYADLAAGLFMTLALCVIARLAIKSIKWPFASSVLPPLIAASISGLMGALVGERLSAGVGRLACQAGFILVFYILLIVALGGRKKLFDLIALFRRVFQRSAFANAG